MLYFPTVCASVWCAVSIEMVWESARTDGRALVLFGHVVAAPPVSATIVILCAVSAVGALAMAVAVAYARGRRLERRMAAELDARWAELAQRDAGDVARRELLNWRLAERLQQGDLAPAVADAVRDQTVPVARDEPVVLGRIEQLAVRCHRLGPLLAEPRSRALAVGLTQRPNVHGPSRCRCARRPVRR